MGIVKVEVPVTGLAENFSPIPRIAPPPEGSETLGTMGPEVAGLGGVRIGVSAEDVDDDGVGDVSGGRGMVCGDGGGGGSVSTIDETLFLRAVFGSQAKWQGRGSSP